MSKFKKGDKVVCVCTAQQSGGGYTHGKTYEVRDTYVNKWGDRIYTVLDDYGSTTNGWGVEFFELYVEPKAKKKTKALQTQIGGSHYTDMVIQPAEYILKNNIGWAEGTAIAYLSRWQKKGGIEDLRKAVQTVELLIETETADKA